MKYGKLKAQPYADSRTLFPRPTSNTPNSGCAVMWLSIHITKSGWAERTALRFCLPLISRNAHEA